jgi:hypothetical protein
MLGPDLGAEVLWSATDTPLQGDMAELVADQWDINKFAHYLPIYDKTFRPHRYQPVRILEMGVAFGGSLELWRNYFPHPDATIVGIDGNPGCAQFDRPDRNQYVRIGKQQDPQFLDALIGEFGRFDIILDDCSHFPSYTLKAFNHLFPHGLKDGGLYLVEDLFSCYIPEGREPFVDTEANDGTPQFMEVVKHLIDVMHAGLYEQTPWGEDVAEKFCPDSPKYETGFTVPWATQYLASIEIYDSIVVIRRGPRELPRTIRRWSRDRMTTTLSAGAAGFLDERPYMDRCDRTRRDWMA